MLAGKSPFDIVGASDNPDCNTEDFLFQGNANNIIIIVILGGLLRLSESVLGKQGLF